MHVLMPSPQHMFINPPSIGAWEPTLGLNRDKLKGTKPVKKNKEAIDTVTLAELFQQHFIAGLCSGLEARLAGVKIQVNLICPLHSLHTRGKFHSTQKNRCVLSTLIFTFRWVSFKVKVEEGLSGLDSEKIGLACESAYEEEVCRWIGSDSDLLHLAMSPETRSDAKEITFSKVVGGTFIASY